ncbi:DUF1330 domain-containing protein [Nocardioides alcanivorans]|uniref:DUF1330 domain-containing protein n=1 Tax=Nocardioides alcanivorans TaxID=2897352 RepID=UPI001F45D430|nr:DUF1330 domain-containing protein [Nocardioides alcanivorans]
MNKAYAFAYLTDVDFNDEIIDYLRRIDDTLAPFGGRFLVHGGKISRTEGTRTGDVIIIEFPDAQAGNAWYDSPAYQAILPLRTENSQGIVALVEGVPTGYRALDKLAAQLPDAPSRR